MQAQVLLPGDLPFLWLFELSPHVVLYAAKGLARPRGRSEASPRAGRAGKRGTMTKILLVTPTGRGTWPPSDPPHLPPPDHPTCQATRQDGRPCRNSPQRKGDLFCWRHRPQPDRATCRATRQDGRPCLGRPQRKGGRFCWRHRQQPKRPTCLGKRADGKPCRLPPGEGEQFCWRHRGKIQ